MPIYEYICTSCETVTELLQKVGAKAPSECKNCGEPDTMKKKVSQTSFQLKGGGWYSDLYGSTPQGGSSKTDISPKSEKIIRYAKSRQIVRQKVRNCQQKRLSTCKYFWLLTVTHL